jgi:hypothetical protein
MHINRHKAVAQLLLDPYVIEKENSPTPKKIIEYPSLHGAISLDI